MCQAVPAHLPPQSLRDYLGEAIRAGEGATYTDIRGIPPLRDALAANVSERYQGSATADDIAKTIVMLGTDASIAMNGHNTVADFGFSAALTTGQVDFSTMG